MCSSSIVNKAYCAIYDYTYSSVNIPSNYQYFNNPNYGGFQPANFCPVPNVQTDESNYYPSSCKVGTSDLDTDYGESIGDTSFCFISFLLLQWCQWHAVHGGWSRPCRASSRG